MHEALSANFCGAMFDVCERLTPVLCSTGWINIHVDTKANRHSIDNLKIIVPTRATNKDI